MKKFLLILFPVCLLADCSGPELLNATIPIDGYRVVHDIPYGGNPRQKLDIYIPDNIKNPAKTVMFVYGGSWRMGSHSGDWTIRAYAQK